VALGLGSIMKLAKGGLGPDELGEILGAAGMYVTFAPVAAGIESFRPLAVSASLPSAKIMELKGTMKGGGSLHALIVMTDEKQA
jgi:hypothetical protein